MKTFGLAAVVTLIIFLGYSLMMFGVSFAGFLGDPLMIASAVVSILLWGVFSGLAIKALSLAVAVARQDGALLGSCLNWTRKLLLTAALLSLGSGFLLALGAFSSCGPLWLSSIYHWGGLVGSFLGFLAYFVMPPVVRACLGEQGHHSEPFGWKAPLITGSVVYGVWGLLWLVLWLVLRGSVDVSTYPANAEYVLPFPAGESSWVIQGNNSSHNHNGAQQYAWDFRRPCGSPVLASRDGTVANFVHNNTGHGMGSPNNFVEIDHGDGTRARYVHIEQGSVLVTSGTVRRGQRIASAGNVGNSLCPHIHFAVWRGSNTIPVKFRDVTEDDGIPRAFNTYTSGNR